MTNRGVLEDSLHFRILTLLGNYLPELGKKTYKNFNLRKSNHNRVKKSQHDKNKDRILHTGRYEAIIAYILPVFRVLVDLSIPLLKTGSGWPRKVTNSVLNYRTIHINKYFSATAGLLRATEPNVTALYYCI
jgi:hypothetical protein